MVEHSNAMMIVGVVVTGTLMVISWGVWRIRKLTDRVAGLTKKICALEQQGTSPPRRDAATPDYGRALALAPDGDGEAGWWMIEEVEVEAEAEVGNKDAAHRKPVSTE